MNHQISQLAFEEVALGFDQWNQLDQLWLYLSARNQELGVSHCYGSQRTSAWLQFTDLEEVRYPVTGELKATPLLSDRPIVARPNQPLNLLAGERMTLYVGTPLWFCLMRGDDVLLDVPVAKLSDSWFGPNTMHGEVCYACPTHARLSMEGVPFNQYKAITPVEIRNQADTAILVDKVNLPIPYLGLYRDVDRHWTSQVTITRETGDIAGHVRISSGPPGNTRSPQELSAARLRADSGMLHKAMSLLLG